MMIWGMFRSDKDDPCRRIPGYDTTIINVNSDHRPDSGSCVQRKGFEILLDVVDRWSFECTGQAVREVREVRAA